MAVVFGMDSVEVANETALPGESCSGTDSVSRSLAPQISFLKRDIRVAIRSIVFRILTSVEAHEH